MNYRSTRTKIAGAAVVILLIVLGPVAGYYGMDKLEQMEGVRTTARAEQLKTEIDRRFPPGTEQAAVIAYFGGLLRESDRHTNWDQEGWYEAAWWRFDVPDSFYAYRGRDDLKILVGKLPHPFFGCGRRNVYLSMHFNNNALLATDIDTARPDCL